MSVSIFGFFGLYCAPAPGQSRRQRVLIFGGSEGGLATAPTAELLASRGFPTLAIAPPTDPAWTLHGKPLPVASPYGDPDSSRNPAAVIPVQDIRGPVLLICGGDDQLWPSPQYAKAIMNRLNSSHDPYPHQELLFPGAGHIVGSAFPYGLGLVTIATASGTLPLGGTPYRNSVAETQAWRDVLAFLGRLGRTG
jgi:pimeloyl-ACP methyl ester carboxylesterase